VPMPLVALIAINCCPTVSRIVSSYLLDAPPGFRAGINIKLVKRHAKHNGTTASIIAVTAIDDVSRWNLGS